MNLITLPPRSSPGRLAWAAGLALLCGGAAWGQASPYVIGASQSISHDSNITHLPDDLTNVPALPKSKTDWISSTALFGGIDQPFGRQRAFANLSVRNNNYRYNDFDNIAYGLAAGLIWSTIERVSGTVKFNSNRTLADFDVGQTGAPVVEKNIERTHQFDATVSVGGVTDVTFDGGYRHQAQRFTKVGNRLSQDQLSIGARHRLGGELTLGAGLRFTSGRYSDLDDAFHGRSLDLSADWVPSPISTVSTRLGYGKTDHGQDTAQDFSGFTGSLAWDWKPTAKVGLVTNVSRATGNESSFGRVVDKNDEIVGAQSDRSRLTSTLGLNATYEATSKILVNAGYMLVSRRLSRTLPAENASDRLNSYHFGVRFLPTRTIELGCNLGRESRSTDAVSSLTYSYSATTVGCSGQISINP
jgi:hypothetical protein